ncbi:hypothetical protein [Helicobacter rodentium]|uniref:hypothetical protein n=1 Tax=Helicobacter rodentium TaxID=59617 RepID=UPI0025737A68|nr:hypothetical protein [Helicobacter rodentium]
MRESETNEAIHNLAKIKFNNGIFKEARYYRLPRFLAESRNDEVGNRGYATL